jgi:acetylornithine deacetylase
MPKIMIDREHLFQTLADLIRINSINPSLTPEGPGEAAIADYVAGWLRRAGLDVHIDEIEPGRCNVVARLKGRGQGRSLAFNAHMDTVGIDDMPEPFSAAVRDGKMYGRGAFDMKGSLAACLAAAKALVDAGVSLGGDLLVVAVADEEYTSIGTDHFVQHYQVDGAVVTEPTGLKVCVAHKGFVWIEVETIGRSAHGSRFREGVDANTLMGRFLCRLERLGEELTQRPGHPLVGPPSLHAARIQGGTELSMYAARCRLQIERRTIPGETEAGVIREIRAILDELSAEDERFRATLKTLLVRQPFEIQPTAPMVQAVEAAAAHHLGHPPGFMGEAFWMDSAILAEAGIETVIIGPVGDGAHAREEWVDLDSVARLAYILAQVALDYCQ